MKRIKSILVMGAAAALLVTQATAQTQLNSLERQVAGTYALQQPLATADPAVTQDVAATQTLAADHSVSTTGTVTISMPAGQANSVVITLKSSVTGQWQINEADSTLTITPTAANITVENVVPLKDDAMAAIYVQAIQGQNAPMFCESVKKRFLQPSTEKVLSADASQLVTRAAKADEQPTRKRVK